jgi:site-specific DNA-methyltransferase (adenine-specific)
MVTDCFMSFCRNIAKKLGGRLDSIESNSRIGSSWVSFYLGEIITLRDKDWNDIKRYFYIPTIDRLPIILGNKSKAVSNYCAEKMKSGICLFLRTQKILK